MKNESLNYLIEEAVRADRRNDAAARNRFESEAVHTYGYCTQAQWDKKFKAASK